VHAETIALGSPRRLRGRAERFGLVTGTAANLAPLVSGARLRMAREANGWTQGELTERIAQAGHTISAAAISQLEKDRSRPSARTFTAIADVTGFPFEFFIGRVDQVDVPGFFRSLRSAAAYERKKALARAHMVNDLLDALGHYVELPDVDLPQLGVEPDSLEFDEIEDIADKVRRIWGLGFGPIANVVLELERHGVVACRLALENKRLDAFSVNFADRPIVVLSEDKGAATRSRFDAAHELGHLVLNHDASHAGLKEAEAQANRFAAAFLMPRAGIEHLLPVSADWRTLMNLKAEWRVSLAALLMRAKTLDVMHLNRYESAMKYMSVRGWRTQEPGERELGAPEQPRLLKAAVDLALSTGDVELEDLAREAALPVGIVRELIADTTGDGLQRPRLRI
jgi:Zn-dependent peptidase ImmA (M78 family)/DNA-binding XRE family transcriptional regulator